MLATSSPFDLFFPYVAVQRTAVIGMAACSVAFFVFKLAGVTADDDGLVWLDMLMDLDVNEAVFILAEIAT